MYKAELRQHIRRLKLACQPPEREALSRGLCRAVQASPQWAEARTVLLYHALPDEVSLSALLLEALRAGKRVLLPVVVGDDLALRPYTGEQSLHSGPFGIAEPLGGDFTAYDQIDLALIPGLAFDAHGHRLGRGRGYYDRLLPRLTRAFLLGVCFPFQLVESVPTDSHDVTVHGVCTGQTIEK